MQNPACWWSKESGNLLPADNSLYNTNAAGWWDENNFLNTLKTGLNPARFGFFAEFLHHLNLQPGSLRVLDAGCGGGILSEEFSRLGCAVFGVDISQQSITVAKQHALQEKLKIEYLVAQAQGLPYEDGGFDIVVCCDVLEHVSNVDDVIAEAARVLKPGGLYMFDTINRTARSFFETILVGQELPITRFFAPHTHDWNQFIRPAELETCFTKYGLELVEIHGLQPAINPLATALEILKLKLGKISYGQFGQRLKFKLGNSTDGSYIGIANRKPFTHL
jgi:2-polyprenyl-6-hydroxyphenyl methylase/3-demethylubiquinone-9 3-methyltransferase